MEDKQTAEKETVDVAAGMNMYSNFFYGPTALVGLGRFFSSLIYTQSVGLVGRVIARRKAVTCTQDNTNTE
jgi:hypothetical protein